MRRKALFGSAMALMLTLAIMVPVFGAPPITLSREHAIGHRPTPTLSVGRTLTISGSGTAYKIGNRTVTESASISLTASVIRSSPGRGMLNFTSGTLTIGSNTYSVVRGHGVITFHNDKMILHLVVKNSAGATFHLLLNGRHAEASSSSAFTVDFTMPQSKLAHLWFLKINGATVTPK